MGIKATEVGRQVNYATYFDLTDVGATVELKITDTEGVTTVLPSSRVTVPSSDIVDCKLGALAGGTYMQFTTTAEDFPVRGTYKLCGTYTDTIPRTLYGKAAMLTVEKKCCD